MGAFVRHVHLVPLQIGGQILGHQVGGDDRHRDSPPGCATWQAIFCKSLHDELRLVVFVSTFIIAPRIFFSLAFLKNFFRRIRISALCWSPR